MQSKLIKRCTSRWLCVTFLPPPLTSAAELADASAQSDCQLTDLCGCWAKTTLFTKFHIEVKYNIFSITKQIQFEYLCSHLFLDIKEDFGVCS